MLRTISSVNSQALFNAHLKAHFHICHKSIMRFIYIPKILQTLTVNLTLQKCWNPYLLRSSLDQLCSLASKGCLLSAASGQGLSHMQPGPVNWRCQGLDIGGRGLLLDYCSPNHFRIAQARGFPTVFLSLKRERTPRDLPLLHRTEVKCTLSSCPPLFQSVYSAALWDKT